MPHAVAAVRYFLQASRKDLSFISRLFWLVSLLRVLWEPNNKRTLFGHSTEVRLGSVGCVLKLCCIERLLFGFPLNHPNRFMASKKRTPPKSGGLVSLQNHRKGIPSQREQTQMEFAWPCHGDLSGAGRGRAFGS